PWRFAASVVTAGNYNWNSRNRDGLGAFLWPNSRAQSALVEAEARHVDHAVYDRRRRRALPRSRGGGLGLGESRSLTVRSVLSRADESRPRPNSIFLLEGDGVTPPEAIERLEGLGVSVM